MRKNIVILCLALLFSTPSFAAIKNIVYVSVDGMSRDTFYSLLKKEKLPNFARIIRRGHYRNMDIDLNHPSTLSSFQTLFYGKAIDVEKPSQSIFDLAQQQEKSVGVILSIPEDDPSAVSLINLLPVDLTVKSDVTQRLRSSVDVGSSLVNFIARQETPFIVFANFSHVDYLGRKYREGSQRYSDAIQKVDRQMGRVLRILEDKIMWDDTLIVMTTTYGFMPKSQILSPKVWVVSSQKTWQKGYQRDIVPSLLSVMGIDHDNLVGRDLFKEK